MAMGPKRGTDWLTTEKFSESTTSTSWAGQEVLTHSRTGNEVDPGWGYFGEGKKLIPCSPTPGFLFVSVLRTAMIAGQQRQTANKRSPTSL